MVFKYISEFCIQNGWKYLSNKGYCIYLRKFICFVLGSFLENPLNIFHILILNTVCLKKRSLIRVIAEWHYVNLLIFLTILRWLLSLPYIQYTFIKKLTQHWLKIIFHSINFPFFSICFYYALNIMTIPYRIGYWNATRSYPVQCRHDLKVSLFVRSENYTQVCEQDFHRAGKAS